MVFSYELQRVGQKVVSIAAVIWDHHATILLEKCHVMTQITLQGRLAKRALTQHVECVAD